MPFKIVRNDITKMKVDAIVNTANEEPIYREGIDTAGYKAASKYIIHAVSPCYYDGESGEEELLRSCYKNSLKLAKENHCESIAFPLISTGSYGYPKEEGMRIAVDEINAFLLKHEMLIYLVVFDSESSRLGHSIYPDLEEYIDYNYVCDKQEEEYCVRQYASLNRVCYEESALSIRMKHLADSFQQYLFYLIETKGLTNAEVYKRAIITKQTFSKIKNNADYHPDKATAMRLCVGVGLNLDETKDLLARAGYALSPCDKRDIIFSYFIENEIFDMIEIDIALEEHGLPCFIE